MPKTKPKHKPGIHLFQQHNWKPKRKDKHGLILQKEWYWHIVSRNGRIIARSSETYARKGSAVKSMVIAAGAFHGFVIRYYDHSKPDSPLQSYL